MVASAAYIEKKNIKRGLHQITSCDKSFFPKAFISIVVYKQLLLTRDGQDALFAIAIVCCFSFYHSESDSTSLEDFEQLCEIF